MVGCCVPQCPSNSRKKSQFKLSFHEFPCKQETRDQWTNFVASLCPEGQAWQPHEGGRTTICSRHFRDEDFVTGVKCRVLKRGAIPSIFELLPICASTLPDQLSTEVIVVDLHQLQHTTTTTTTTTSQDPPEASSPVQPDKTILYDYLRTSLPELFASPGQLDDMDGSGQVAGSHPDGQYDLAGIPDQINTMPSSSAGMPMTHPAPGSSQEANTHQDGQFDPAVFPNQITTMPDSVTGLSITHPNPTSRKAPTRPKRPAPSSDKSQRISVKDRKKFYHTPLEAIRILRQRIASKRAQICRLRRTVHSLEEEVGRHGAGRVRNDENRDAQRLRTAAEAGDPSAVFLLDMVRARQMKHVRCSELTVRYCKLLRSRFAPAYEFIRKSGLLRLPSRQTLGRYAGEGGGGVGAGRTGEGKGGLEQPLVEQEVLMDDVCQPSEIVLDEDCLM